MVVLFGAFSLQLKHRNTEINSALPHFAANRNNNSEKRTIPCGADEKQAAKIPEAQSFAMQDNAFL